MDPLVRPIIESLIFSSELPLKQETIRQVMGNPPGDEIEKVLQEIGDDYRDERHGFELVHVADGYQFRTKPRYAEWIRKLRKSRGPRLTRSSLEGLAIVAYRQPVIRTEVEAIRGVDSGSVIKTLLERKLIRIVGRKDVPGRPLVYGTTREFLHCFGLNSLSDLPTMREIEELHKEAPPSTNPPK